MSEQEQRDWWPLRRIDDPGHPAPWVDATDCHHETWRDALMSAAFDVCGCAERDEMLDELIEHLRYRAAETKPRREFDAHFYWVATAIEGADWAEHGTSIRFGWLTPRGKEVLAFIEERLKEEAAETSAT